MESPRKQRILIVDDDSAVQVSLALLLKQAGYDTQCTDDPAQALAALAAQPVDLVHRPPTGNRPARRLRRTLQALGTG